MVNNVGVVVTVIFLLFDGEKIRRDDGCNKRARWLQLTFRDAWRWLHVTFDEGCSEWRGLQWMTMVAAIFFRCDLEPRAPFYAPKWLNIKYIECIFSR